MTDEKDTYERHISHTFNEEMSGLKDTFLRMGGIVEQQVESAVVALVEGDYDLAEKVRLKDKEVDQIEREIDELAVHLIARRQPAASDLRLVVAVVKMVSDIERIGDEAKKIAKLAMILSRDSSISRGHVEVRHLSTYVRAMVKDGLDAFARFDSGVALRILKEDDKVDQEYSSAARALMTFMMEDPRSITHCMNILWILRALERIGDHASNIAEQVIFLVEGSDVRHQPIEKTEEIVTKKPQDE